MKGTRKNSIVVGGLLLAVILVGLLFLYPGSDDPSGSAFTDSSFDTDSADPYPDNVSDEVSEPGDGQPESDSALHGVVHDAVPATFDAVNFLRESLENRRSIIETYEEMAVHEGWPYDDLIHSLFLWRDLCVRVDADWGDRDVQSDDQATMFLGRTNYAGDSLRGMPDACADLDEKLEGPLEDLMEVSGMELVDGTRRSDALLEQLTDLEADRANHRIMAQLDQALSSANEAHVQEIVWLLLFSMNLDLIDPPLVDIPESSILYSPIVSSHLGSALMCRQIGGCDGTHPIVIRQCVLLSGRYCHRPRDMFDVAAQTMTGLEYVAFQSAYDQITSRLAAYRRLGMD